MKFQLKALAAAVVLSASSLSAQAAMDLSKSGDGSFILSVWNADLGSATFDLGYNYSTFGNLTSLVDQNGTVTFDLTAANYGNAWDFIKPTGASSAPTYWAVFAGDNAGSARTKASFGFYTTANSTYGMSQLSSTASLNTGVLANMDTYIAAANYAPGNHSTVANGANTSTLTANSGAGSGGAYGSGSAGAAGPIANAALDQTQTMLKILSQGNSAPTAEFMTNADGIKYEFTLTSAGLLNVTAVPEADSYAMLLAGLGVLGLVARRRKA